MLQIISGKFFKHSERYVHDCHSILYTNFSYPAPIQTSIGTLKPVDAYGGTVASYVFEYKNQMERDPKAMFAVVKVGDEEIARQFQMLTVFGMNAFAHHEKEAVQRHCRTRPRDAMDAFVPSIFLPDTFAAKRYITGNDIPAFTQFVDKMISLPRKQYLAVMTCLEHYYDALSALSDNFDLAYSMLIYCLESLSQQFDAYTSIWDNYDQSTKSKLESEFAAIDTGKAEAIKRILVNASHQKLMSRFINFACKFVTDSFFRQEANGILPALRPSHLRRALQNAYSMRSKFVHELARVQHQLAVPHFARGDVFTWGNEPYLTLKGLTRLFRHIVLNFVKLQPSLEKEDYNWRADLPGTVMAELHPRYWIWRHDTISPNDATHKISAFLEHIAELEIGSEKELINIKPLLDEYEKHIDTAIKIEDKLAIYTIYTFYNSYAAPQYRCTNSMAFIQQYESLTTHRHILAIILKIYFGKGQGFDAKTCATILDEYDRQKHKEHHVKLPLLFDGIALLTIANLFREAGDTQQFEHWMNRAILELAGHTKTQDLLQGILNKRTDFDYLAFCRTFALDKGHMQPTPIIKQTAAQATPPPEEISTAAYYLWEKDGCPHGNDWKYWFLAEQMHRMQPLNN